MKLLSTLFASVISLSVLTFAAEKKDEKSVPKKSASKTCQESLTNVKERIPVSAKLANITWAEARARADQMERFEREMPKSDLLPYFSKACSLYVDLISLYAETDSLNASTRNLWNKRALTDKSIEETLNKIGEARTGKVNALAEDLANEKSKAIENDEEAKKREEALKAAAISREDSLRAASEQREKELQKALADERAKAEARQAEAKEKLNKLQSKLIKVTQDARGIILSMSDILFDVDKASLKPDLQTSLAKVAGILSVYQELEVSVEGHTDNTGSDEHNMKLSEQRAKNVLDFLVSQGIDAARLSSKGYGKTRPVGDNSTKEGRQKNRRVDLVIHDKSIQNQGK